MHTPFSAQKSNGSSSHPEHAISAPAGSALPDATLRLRLFGPLDARRGETSLPRLRSRKEQWLLALLALRGPAAVERVWLAGTLWPECSEERALGNLRRSLSALRAALGVVGGKWIISPKPGSLALNEAGLEVDVRAFDAALVRGDDAALEEAVALYRGPLLEGCMEEWAVGERRVREEAYLQARETLAERTAGRGEVQAAARHLRLVLETDPFREAALRRLMETLAQAGEPLAARRAYRDFRRLLRTEMNARPASETQALFRRLQSAEAAAPKSNCHLPYALTPLVGRCLERRKAAEALDAARLVTLTGVGGAGKTRLAIAVAEDCAEEYADGVWFVDLSALSDPQLLPASMAAALGLRRQDEPRAALDAFLGDRSVLLVLDNCEHLIGACAALAADLLGGCPGLRVLATSREPLGLFGEAVWPVPPLSLASADGLPSDAVRLFAERARQAGGPQRLDASLRPVMMAICRRLDGLPLAIELAAARTRAMTLEQIAMTLEQIARRLDDRLGLLRQGSQMARPRHQTLRATLDWSYNLMTEPEKALLCRLSVFASGWTLEAGEGSPGVRARALNSLGWLVSAQGDLEASHSLYEQALVIFREIGDRGGGAHSLNFMGSMKSAQGDFEAARSLYEQALEIHREIGDRGGEAHSLQLSGVLAYRKGDWGAACSLDEQALAIYRVTNSRNGEASILNNLGMVKSAQSDFEASRSYFEQALAIFCEIGNRDYQANSLCNLGVSAYYQGDLEAARSYFEQSLPVFREIGDRPHEANSLNNLGIVAREQGGLAEARALFTQSLVLKRRIGNPTSTLETLEEWATLAFAEDAARRAARLAGAAQAGREALSISLFPHKRDTHERTLTGARAALGEDAFTEAWDAGRAMMLDEAVEYALAGKD